MHPTLFRLGPWEARSYGVFLAVSFLLGILLARHRARRAGLDSLQLFVLCIAVVVAAIVGSRLTYVLVNLPTFAEKPLAVIDIWDDGVFRLSGLVMNGGIVAAIATILAFTRWKGLPTLRTLDTIAPSLAIGILFTRLGCFLNGCCYGKPTDLAVGVVFPPDSPAGSFQRSGSEGLSALHPTQLYSSAYGLAILAAVLVVERRYKRFDGFTTCVFLLTYSVARFSVEFYRHFHDDVGLILGLTHNQHLSIALAVISTAGLLLLSRRARRRRQRALAAATPISRPLPDPR